MLFSNTNEGEGSFMADIINKMITKFNKYWGGYNLLIYIAPILDLINKIKFIDVAFQKYILKLMQLSASLQFMTHRVCCITNILMLTKQMLLKKMFKVILKKKALVV